MTALAAPPPVSMREVAERIIADQAGAMRRLRKRARRGELEAVHDLRVATRRLRAALRVFRDFVAPAGGVRKRLRRLARRLGAVRDRDVLASLLAAQLGERLGEDERRRLARLVRAVRRKRRRKLARLERALDATAVRALRRRARRLSRTTGLDDDAAAIGLTRAVTRLAAEVAREPAMLEAAPSEEALHRLRIAMKRLRYALEFHAGAGGLAYDAELGAARELQACLGELHDVDVLRAAMRLGKGAFAGPWPATSRRLRAARQRHLARFLELRDRWRELTRTEPAYDTAAAFPALEAAPVQLRLVSGGKQIASTMIR